MGIVSGAVVYIMVWWVVLFTVLPWGVTVDDRPAPGMADSAPAAPRLKTKLLATTLISALVWLLLDAVISWSGLSFREWAKTL